MCLSERRLIDTGVATDIYRRHNRCIEGLGKRLFENLRHRREDNINPLTPNDLYISRTAPLTSKRRILYIYSTNVGTEYFKHALYYPFFLFKMQFVS